MEKKVVGINKDITTEEPVLFILNTTDISDCLQTPYKITTATIYFISRDFITNDVSEYTKKNLDERLKKEYETAQALVCASPTTENINKLSTIKTRLENSIVNSPFFFKEAIPIKIFGNETNPAWLNPDLVPVSERTQVIQDNILKQYEENNQIIDGKFVLEWDTIGQREGDYFICWEWQPNLSGDRLSSHFMFSLMGNTKATTAIPIHYTDKEKYEILMDRYLPEMFKTKISDTDLSPVVLQELNKSVAKGFTFLEDFVNQMIDMLDANVLQEKFLPLLANIFNLNLKSNDQILWRRQIKKAIYNYKQKGTLGGLKSALSDIGVKLLKLTKLWQVISKYTYQESFVVEDYSNKFTLKKGVVLPINPVNFGLWIRLNGTENWQELSSDYIDITTDNISGDFILNWVGESLSIFPIPLDLGDEVRVLYQFQEIPNIQEQNLEDYVRSLDAMDQRDVRRNPYPELGWDEAVYPPKNWNTKVLEEDDALFDILIPNRHPISDHIVWGKIRTEFPYSENAYNMDEYNGSTRDSTNPCDIDKEFIDPCKDCQSSKFSIDVEIEDISEDRIIECKKTIEEFVPFHAVIHLINFVGSVNEFVKSPIEDISVLLDYFGEEVLISGEAQNIFNRSIPQVIPPQDLSNPTLTYPLNLVRRNVLANMQDRTGTVSGTGFNNSISLFAPGSSTTSDLNNSAFAGTYGNFDKTNIDETNISGSPLNNSNLLEVLGPSLNSGLYSVKNTTKNSFEIAAGTVNESPLDESQFEFRISNKTYEQSSVDILQDNLYLFYSNVDITDYNITSQKDIDENISSEAVWKVKINQAGYFDYEILEVLPNNILILKGPMLNANVNNLNWELLDSNGDSVYLDYFGEIKYKYRAIVDLAPGSFGSLVDDIRNYAKIGDYLYYNSNQYKIDSFVSGENHKFYIENYSSGDVGGVLVKIYRRIVENCVGQFGYQGIRLQTSTNYETTLPIQNGTNAWLVQTKESEFKENYLILINSNYYSITDINNTTIILNGPMINWKTTGTPISFTIYQFINQPLSLPERVYPSVPGHNFEQVVRSSNEIITQSTEIAGPLMPLVKKILNSKDSGTEIFDVAKQTETIHVSIEYTDGTNEEKQL